MILVQDFNIGEIITKEFINLKIGEADASDRRRAAHVFSNPGDNLQEIMNACMFDTYIRPHIHGLNGNPKKAEKVKVLKGKIGVIEFDAEGKIIQTITLDEASKGIYVAPETWHGYVILSESAAVYEKIYGAYDSKTHKQFADWSPEEEDSPKVKAYMDELRLAFNGPAP